MTTMFQTLDAKIIETLWNSGEEKGKEKFTIWHVWAFNRKCNYVGFSSPVNILSQEKKRADVNRS